MLLVSFEVNDVVSVLFWERVDDVRMVLEDRTECSTIFELVLLDITLSS